MTNERNWQLWRNDMPTSFSGLAEKKLLEYPRGANIHLMITKTPLYTADSSSTTPTHASIRGIHVFRVTPVDPCDAGAREDGYFYWRSEDKLEEEYSRMRKPEMEVTYTDVIDVMAWNGPRFGGRQVEHFVVVEFEGGVFLKSQVTEMATCS